MKNRQDYVNEAPAMLVKMRELHPSLTYARSLHSEINDLQNRLRELQTKKQIASFLMKTDAENMHRLIEEVNNEIRNIAENR